MTLLEELSYTYFSSKCTQLLMSTTSRESLLDYSLLVNIMAVEPMIENQYNLT